MGTACAPRTGTVPPSAGPMRRQPTLQMFTPVLGALLLGVSHLATPLALSAQSSATLQIGARVMPAEGAWEAHSLAAEAVSRVARRLTTPPRTQGRLLPAPEITSGPSAPSLDRGTLLPTPDLGGRVERIRLPGATGVTAWAEFAPAPTGTPVATVTVAHLGN